MDFNKEYAAHQGALMQADNSVCTSAREGHVARASTIARRIGAFQHELGAAAACASSIAQMTTAENIS